MALVKLVVRTPGKLSETVSALLFEAGAGGIEELDGGRRLVVYSASRADADGIAERARELLRDAVPGPSGVAFTVEVDEHSDWDSAWTKHLGQVALTSRLVIQPLWEETPAPLGAERILFDPKLAFGDGGHPTTRLAAGALERACHAHAGRRMRVLDVGSGTGVLAFVALLSGAEAAWGIDIDPLAILAAQRNAELNGLHARATFSAPSELAAADFELVVANLELPALRSLSRELAGWAARAQRLILTGFLSERAAEVRALFAPAFALEGQNNEADWALLELTPLG